MKYENPVVTLSNVNEITEHSLNLQAQIDEMTKERQYLSKFLVDFLVSTGEDTYVTDNNRYLKLLPVLSRSLAKIDEDERSILTAWAIEKYPELIVVNHSRLQKLLSKGVVCPISMSSNGFSIRISRKPTGQKVRNINELHIKSDTPIRPPKPKTVEPKLDQEEKKLQKKATHEERLERLVDMQSMWDHGETFRAIAKKYGMNSGYVKKMLAPYIRSRMNQMRKAISIQQQKGDTMVSIEI